MDAGLGQKLANVVVRMDEVTGSGRAVSTLCEQLGASHTFVDSLDDLAHAAVEGARPGQPIGVLRSGRGLELVPLDSPRKAVAMVSPHNWLPMGGLTIRTESVHALDDRLVGITSMRSNGSLGRFHEAGVVPRSAVFG